MMNNIDIDCPVCHSEIHVPFIRDLEAKAIEDFDLAEITAQEKYASLKKMLERASLWSLIRFWWRKRK